MKKHAVLFILCFSMVIGIMPAGIFASEPGPENFKKVNTYVPGQFEDVSASDWFAPNVADAYELGLMIGAGDAFFNAYGDVTVAEAVTMAARIHSIYTRGSDRFEKAALWYRPYLDYAVWNGVIAVEYADYGKAATRAEFAEILAGALPAEALGEINIVADGAIPDVDPKAEYAPEVYKLYRAGILAGNDDHGTFTPDSNIARAAAAAIVTRMADASLRVKVTLKEAPVPAAAPADDEDRALTAGQIFAECSPAMFFIEAYDADENLLSSGSGFFIDAGGTAVTNFHVIGGASRAKVRTPADGKEYDVAGVYGYSKANGLALIKINGSGFPYLQPGDPDTLKGGAAVYAIGSPSGAANTISEGTLAGAGRVIDGVPYIQFSASVPQGGIGGALLDGRGRVIGVTGTHFTGGTDLNLAVPVRLTDDLARGSLTDLRKLLISTEASRKVTASVMNFTVYEGASRTVTVYTENTEEDDFLRFRGGEPNVTLKWEDRTGIGSVPLTVTGKAAGETVFRVELLENEDGAVIDVLSVYVKVVGSSRITGYSDFPAVPDFGAYFGIERYYQSNEYDGSGEYYAFYIYEYEAVPGGGAAGEYQTLLKQNGFSYDDYYYNEKGEKTMIYNHVRAGITVLTGTYSAGGKERLSIFIKNSE